MSGDASDRAHDLGHGHGHTHVHAHEDGHAPHATRKGYLIGFGLSVILTAIPFWLVMGGVLGSPALTGYVIMGFALVQVLVHMVYFLHMSSKSESGWTLMATIFTVTMVAIALIGSMWVMHNMNANMMPGMDQTGEMSGM